MSDGETERTIHNHQTVKMQSECQLFLHLTCFMKKKMKLYDCWRLLICNEHHLLIGWQEHPTVITHRFTTTPVKHVRPHEPALQALMLHHSSKELSKHKRACLILGIYLCKWCEFRFLLGFLWVCCCTTKWPQHSASLGCIGKKCVSMN